MADPKEALGALLKALNAADRKIKNILKDPKLVAQVTEVLNEVNPPSSPSLSPSFPVTHGNHIGEHYRVVQDR